MRGAAAIGLTVVAAACTRPSPTPPPRAERSEETRRPAPPPPAGPLRRVAAAPLDDCLDPEPLELVAERDVVYAPPRDGRDRWLDVYRPRVAGAPLPAILLFHGGSWSGGDEDGLEARARWLARLGFAVAAVRYRLASGRRPARFPAAVADARCATRFLRGAADRFGLDPGRLFAGGFSAGGHLAAMLALAPDVAGLDEGCPDSTVAPDVMGAFAWYAPLVLDAAGPRTEALDRIVANFLGVPPAADPTRARLASAPPHVDAGDPPMLLVHGAEDALVPPSHSATLAAALGRAAVPHTLLELEGLGHGFSLLGGRPEERRAACTTAAFLRALVGVPLASGGDATRAR